MQSIRKISLFRFLVLLLAIPFLLIANSILVNAEEAIKFNTNDMSVNLNKNFELPMNLNQIDQDDDVLFVIPDFYHIDKEKTINANKSLIKNIIIESSNHEIQISLNEQKQQSELVLVGSFEKTGEFVITGKFKNIEVSKTVTVNKESEASLENSTSENSTLESSTNKNDQSSTTISKESEKEVNSTEQQVEKSNEKEKNTTDQSTEDKKDTNVSRAAPLSFNWNLLNTDGLDLSKFVQVTKNTPVKLTGGKFDQQQRTYYMFLGHGNGKYNKINNEFIRNSGGLGSDIYKDVGTSSTSPLLQPVLIGVQKGGISTKQEVFTYDYRYSANDNSTSNTFDIGEMSQPNGPIEFCGSVKNGDTYTTQIVKQYVRGNELVAYGWAPKSIPHQKNIVKYQPVRIHGYVHDYSSGRVRFDVDFYNNDRVKKYYAPLFGMHVDIGGAHKSSKLFSNSADGLYFNEDGTNSLADKIGTNIFFHTSNYGEKNGPNARKTGNYIDQTTPGSWGQLDNETKNSWINGSVQGYLNPYERWDTILPRGMQYNLEHPIFDLRWDPIPVEPGGVGEVSYDISLEETKPVMPYAEKNFKNLTSKDKKNHIGDELEFLLTVGNRPMSNQTWKNVSILDKIPVGMEVDPSSFKLTTSKGSTPISKNIYNEKTKEIKYSAFNIDSGAEASLSFKTKIISKAGTTIINTMKASNGAPTETVEASVNIPVVKDIKKFKLIEQVFFENGKEVDKGKVTRGEKLVYRATVKAPFTGEETDQGYQSIIVDSGELDKGLENFSDYVLKDSDGKIISSSNVIYDSKKNHIVATVDVKNGTPISAKKDIYLEYKAVVKNNLEKDTKINATSNASAELASGNQIPSTSSNQVTVTINSGELQFVSAPKVIDYGNKLKIEEKDRTYDMNEMDDDLIVQDSRGKGSQWTMVVKLTNELTSTEGHELTNSMYFNNGKIDTLMLLNTSITVENEHTTESDDEVNLSKDWIEKKEGLLLKVKAGKAYPESYSGKVEWLLEDVPS